MTITYRANQAIKYLDRAHHSEHGKYVLDALNLVATDTAAVVIFKQFPQSLVPEALYHG